MPRNRLLLASAGIAVTAAGASVLFLFDPAQSDFYPVCFLHLATGLNCPGCGSMRAIHQLLHGHVVTAARFNLLLLLCLPHAAYWTVRSGARWLSGQPVQFAIRPVWLWAFLVVATAFTVIRNLPGFEWLGP
jgi:hypothetical protein